MSVPIGASTHTLDGLYYRDYNLYPGTVYVGDLVGVALPVSLSNPKKFNEQNLAKQRNIWSSKILRLYTVLPDVLLAYSLCDATSEC